MFSEGRQFWWGILIIAIVFIAVILLVNSIGWVATFLTAYRSPQNLVSEQLDTTNVLPSQPIPSPVSDEKDWASLPNHLYFPCVMKNGTQDTSFQLKNVDQTLADDIIITLINKAGEQHSYRPIKISPEQYYRLDLKNLANVPDDFAPGLAVFSSHHQIAAAAEIVNNDNTIPEYQYPLTPYFGGQTSLAFSLTSTGSGTIQQNRLVITNLDPVLTEIQMTAISDNGTVEILPQQQVQPLTTAIIDLTPLLTNKEARYRQLRISSARNIIGATATLDIARGTWGNISIE